MWEDPWQSRDGETGTGLIVDRQEKKKKIKNDNTGTVHRGASRCRYKWKLSRISDKAEDDVDESYRNKILPEGPSAKRNIPRKSTFVSRDRGQDTGPACTAGQLPSVLYRPCGSPPLPGY